MSEMYGNIKIDSGIRKIGVNDAGDYIELSVTDVTLLDRFSNLVEWFSSKQEELARFDEDFKARHAGDTDDTEAVIEAIHKRTEAFRETCKQIDNVFGEGCCKKVFGNIIPDELPLMDFFDQMTPVMQRMAAERGEKLKTKYSRDRKGKQKQRSKNELIADLKARNAAGEPTDGGTEL
nr:MAG TPA: tail assembly chaperone protein [Caudoviricetes sp.]